MDNRNCHNSLEMFFLDYTVNLKVLDSEVQRLSICVLISFEINHGISAWQTHIHFHCNTMLYIASRA